MRSWLFVPGDSDKKLAKGLASGADVVVVDLEDSVAAGNKEGARETARAFLRSAPAERPRLFVRVNDLASGLIDADLDAVLAGRPDGIMLPKPSGGADVGHLDAKLTAREAEHGIADGATSIIVVATETAVSLFHLGSYRGSSARLEAMTWGAEDLSADLGATASRDSEGRLTGPYQLARSLCLAGAVSAEAQPVDTVYVNFRDEAGLRAECAAAARDGFTGKLAIHPAQVAPINEIFTPSAEAIERARRIALAFREAGDAGVVGLDGEMFDRPHLTRAEKLLERARSYGVID